jgi:hypothetical protein
MNESFNQHRFGSPARWRTAARSQPRWRLGKPTAPVTQPCLRATVEPSTRSARLANSKRRPSSVITMCYNRGVIDLDAYALGPVRFADARLQLGLKFCRALRRAISLT